MPRIKQKYVSRQKGNEAKQSKKAVEARENLLELWLS